MELRVMQWNISWKRKLNDVARFVTERRGTVPAIVCLEEVQFRSTYDRLKDSLKPTDSCFSLNWREAGKNESKGRELGIAVFAFGLSIVSSELPKRTVYPERTLSVLLDGDSGPVRLVAFHSLAGVNFGLVKSSNFAAIADYLQLHRSELDFVCFDGSEPRHDSMDASKVDFSPRGRAMALIMGKEKVHDLTDSYVDYLKSKGEVVTADPLTVSNQTGSAGTKHKKRRYDYIMHSPRWHVNSCEYPYEESIAATSDHSAVIADFELRRESVEMPSAHVECSHGRLMTDRDE
jgi:hypothetical protein